MQPNMVEEGLKGQSPSSPEILFPAAANAQIDTGCKTNNIARAGYFTISRFFQRIFLL